MNPGRSLRFRLLSGARIASIGCMKAIVISTIKGRKTLIGFALAGKGERTNEQQTGGESRSKTH
jgi:hypothetical protein